MTMVCHHNKPSGGGRLARTVCLGLRHVPDM